MIFTVGDSFDLRYVFGLLRRRIWFIIAIMVVVIGGACLHRHCIDALGRNRLDANSRVQSAEASLSQRDWNAVANSLRDAAVADLERQRENLLSRLGQTANGSPAAIDLRTSLQKVETTLETTARQVASGLKRSLPESQSRVTEHEVRSTVASLVSAKDEAPMLVLLNQQSASPTACKGRYAGYYAEA